ncbi:hypothetical protein [Cupriavidus taiwanensis]|uniref:hypothetical protein n=1 Tax=Cupriavidus taiwanensis TaxID=164546 RepID=UPI000E125484|nr:hypothetical protein [Cupriavidus taiwanensis]SPA17246.1 hypothetical protein CBM2631_A90322 [Cupriavidus taiwanensis]
MRRLTISIETRNDAFDEVPHLEVARILRALADRIESGAFASLDFIPIRDTNGALVGQLDAE